jgi:hypothetical protein
MRALKTSAFAAMAAAAIVLTTASAAPAMAAGPSDDWTFIHLYSDVNFTGSVQNVPGVKTGCTATDFPVKSAIDYTGVVGLTLYTNANCTGQPFVFSSLNAGAVIGGPYKSYVVG